MRDNDWTWLKAPVWVLVILEVIKILPLIASMFIGLALFGWAVFTLWLDPGVILSTVPGLQ